MAITRAHRTIVLESHGAVSPAWEPSNKRMQLTKLRAAPERQDKVPPCAPAGRMDGGTASQLIRSVRQTLGRRGG
jgi:hypothetical protein